MKKKKLIIISVIFFTMAFVFLRINRYMLNKDNKGSVLENTNNSQENINKQDNEENHNKEDSGKKENNSIQINADKNLEEKNNEIKSEANSNNNSIKNNNSATNNNSSKQNSGCNHNSSASENKSNNNTKKDDTSILDSKLSSKYPAIAKVSGKEITKGKTKNGFTITEIAGITYIDGIMMVNKTYGLPSDYLPVDTVEDSKGKTNTCNKCINKLAYSSFATMKADAAALGLNIYIASGYRPYVSQENIYNRYVKRDGKKAADTYSARPGYSEHQTSYTFDLNSINDSFAKTNEGKWVNENAYLYGFIIRFPKGKDSYTGYKYESWHLRYVGYDLARKLYNNGNWISLEEYFGVDSKYQD